MIEQILAIVRNTFFESIRQPIMLVLLVAATCLLVLSNPLSAFTMEDDQRMLVSIGMATIFLTGALLAAFVATGVLTREIENKTALTIISKPVGRPLFVIGKFLGVAGALLLATIFMSLVFMLVELHSVLQTVRDPYHLPVITFGVGGSILGVGAAVWCNYFYGKVFASSVICFVTPILAVAYLLSMMFRHDFTPQPISLGFKPDLWLGIVCLTVAILVLTAIAVAASARLSQIMTLVVTLGVFLLGLLSDWLLARPMRNIENLWLERAGAAGLTETVEFNRSFTLTTGEVLTSPTAEFREVPQVALSTMAEGAETLIHGGLHAARSILPNLQVLWLSDALTQGHKIPISYVLTSCLYGGFTIVAAIALAIILFQRREVG